MDVTVDDVEESGKRGDPRHKPRISIAAGDRVCAASERVGVAGAEVRLEATRQDAPPKLILIRYDIIVDSAETDQRLDLLHRNVLKYGTISNTLAGAVPLEGTLRRKSGGG